ncbi:MAG: LPS assembly lipoprotein LptE [Bacteroidia bacterium]|nr:LPS assembly lipoprotein LptE [Bacteroidia bacterium]
MIGRLLIFLLVATLSGCGVYSHTGASIPPDAKTFSVAYIVNNASIVAPTLSQVLTERLKTKFINETGLKLSSIDGDLHFSGKITDYKTAPAAIGGNQATTTNRLTVTIEINFENKKDPTKNFQQSFSNFVDFDASQNFASIESDLIAKVTEGLVQDVFNKAFINW